MGSPGFAVAESTKWREYIADPANAPPGVQVVTGPNGGFYYERQPGQPLLAAPGAGGAAKKPAKGGGGGAAPKKASSGGGGAKKGGAGGAGGAAKPKPRQPGQPFGGRDDLNLPASVKKEPPERRQLFADTFNAVLAAGGGEIDANRIASSKLVVPKPPKPVVPKPVAKPVAKKKDELQLAAASGEKVIRKVDGKWVLFTADGSRRLGEFTTRKDALRRERQIQFFKHEGKELAAVANDNETVFLLGEKFGYRKLPRGWTRASMSSFFGKMGGSRMRSCITKMTGHVSDPAAFCNAMQQQATGHSNKPGKALEWGEKASPAPAALLLTADVDDGAVRKDLAANGIAGLRFSDAGDIEPLDDGSLAAWLDALGFKALSAAELDADLLAEDEKCGPDMAMPMAEPSLSFGGATSFAEIDAYQQTAELTEEVGDLSNEFQAISANVMNSFLLTPQQKATAMATAAGEFQRRLGQVDAAGGGMKALDTDELDAALAAVKEGRRVGARQLAILKRLFDDVKGLFGWASYSDGSSQADEESKEKARPKVLGGGFKVYERDGRARWLSFSSNAFEDVEGELFSTKALTDAVTWSDATGERGPLRLYHVPASDIGHCDFQEVVGRFLVESGTFADTALGRRAEKYFKEHSDQDYGVSIGYLYRDGDERDGTYDWLRFRERSVTPPGLAANPWTEFKIGGGLEMDARKEAFLKEVLGDDLARTVIATAETRTKELEEASVRFKEKTTTSGETTATGATTTGSTTATTEAPKGETTATGETTTGETLPTAEAVAAMTESVKALGELIKSYEPRLADLTTAVAELRKSDDEKVAALIAPRRQVPASTPSTSDATKTIDEKLINAITGEKDGGAAVSPVAKYISMLGNGQVAAE